MTEMRKATISRLTTEYPFLIMTEDGKYEWGNVKKDSVILPLEEARKIQGMLGFETLLTKIGGSSMTIRVSIKNEDEERPFWLLEYSTEEPTGMIGRYELGPKDTRDVYLYKGNYFRLVER